MAYQTGRQIEVAYKPEATYGELPGATDATVFRPNSGNLTLGIEAIRSNENRRDGMTTRGRHGSRSVTGQYAGDLSVGSYDELIEAVLRGTFEAAVTIDESAAGLSSATLAVAANAITASAGSWITAGLRVGDVIRLTTGFDAGNLNRNLRITGLTATVNLGTVTAGTLSANVSFLGTVYADQIAAISLSAITANLGKVTAGELSANVSYLGTVNANQINTSTLSAITANLGTVNAGSINGVTFTGGTIQTKVSGERIVLDGSNNIMLGYDSSNRSRFAFGGNSVGSGAFSNYGNLQCLYVEAASTGSSAHAIRARNSGSGGGEALLGLSSGGGGYALNAIAGGVYSAGGYLPFTGKHEALAKKDAGIDVGDIVVVKRVLARDGLDNVLTEVVRSASICDRRVIGIVSEVKELSKTSTIAALGGEPKDKAGKRKRGRMAKQYLYVTVNALGEGQMLVCGRGGDIGAGNYIVTSDLAGKGQGLDMDQPVTFGLQAAIVAQAMIDVTFDDPDQVKTAPVFYRCG